MFGRKHKPEDIKSAHEKQMRKVRGEGGIRFTEAEQDVLDDYVDRDEAED